MRFSIPTVLLIALSLASQTLAQDHANLRTISTSGESIVYVVPDEVIVNFGIETFNADLDKSKSENDDRSAKLLKAIKALGVEDKHIQTDTLTLEIQYNEHGRPINGISGYLARRMYSITLKDTKLFEKTIDAALKNGANRLAGFEFRTSELRKHRDQARKMAIKAAKEKAIALATELDMKVGKPRTIGEGYSAYAGYRGWYGGNAQMYQNSIQVADAGGGETDEVLPLGQIAIRANISVTFDLE